MYYYRTTRTEGITVVISRAIKYTCESLRNRFRSVSIDDRYQLRINKITTFSSF